MLSNESSGARNDQGEAKIRADDQRVEKGPFLLNGFLKGLRFCFDFFSAANRRSGLGRSAAVRHERRTVNAHRCPPSKQWSNGWVESVAMERFVVLLVRNRSIRHGGNFWNARPFRFEKIY